MVYLKCNPNFQSQFAYLDNQSIHISDYLNNRSSYTDKKICCNKGHELVAVNPGNRKKHFRHKNSSDMEGHPMSAWHAEWQGRFPVTEITYKRKDFNQVSERRADVVLNDTTILELQHSLISPAEVFSRKYDYSLHGKNIIWVIDGNQGIEVKELPGSNRCFLFFSSDNWRYKSFNQYNAIYIDIQDKIYKVVPKLVKSDMTDVSEPKSKEEFIHALNISVNLWDDSEPPQCELLVKQQGAGNGKTFGIIQNIKDPAFSHYDTFIYVTKQHSAKYTMFKELREQINGTDKLLPQFEEYETNNISDKNDPKKFIYEFKHKESNDKKQLIFATIDSFMYSVGKSDEQAYDTFLGIVNNINKDTDDEETTMKIENSSIHFAKKRRKLNKKTIFIVDECQDLDSSYARAIIKIMRTTYMDCLVVGDILQSIHFETNAFSFFMSDINDNEIMPFIKRTKLTPTNICQRFKRNELVDFVNMVVNFNYNSMNLPPVTAASPEETAESSIQFFKASGKGFDDDSTNESLEEDISQHLSMTENLEIIMDLFQKEVFENDRKPNDFLLVTPFTSNNLLAKELELRIHLFWENHLKDTTADFCKYAVFHRSQEGTSINLDESLHATRIVSCHSAKGDGRNVVFLLGFTEKTINIFSKRTNSLIFESMVNVAMTRMKQKLYIQYTPNGDILHKRYYEYCCSIEKKVHDIVPILPTISRFMQLSKLIDNFDGKENWDFFKPILEKGKITSIDNENANRQIVDMGHHSIRKCLMDMRFMISIVMKERSLLSQEDFRKKQQLCIFETIGKSSVRYCDEYGKYNSDLAILCDMNDERRKVFPLLRLRGKTKGGRYYHEVLNKFMVNMIQYADDLIKGKTKRLPCPFETLVLYFMKEQLRNGWRADISIFFLYDILDKYEHGFQQNEIHSECPCNAFFQNTQTKTDDKSMDVFHVGFYNHLERVDKNLSEMYSNNPKLAWLSNHPIYYDGGNNEFALNQQIKYHAYDDYKREVILCYLKPQHNALNDKDTYMRILMDTWLLLNYKKDEKNILKYAGKKIKACILSLDSDIPLYIDVEDIAREYNSEIFQLVFDRWTHLLTRTNDAVFYFYNFYRNKMISQKKNTSEFCKELYKKIKVANEKNSEVKFIRDFFIGDLLIDSNNLPATIKDAIFKEYDDKEKFIKSLRDRLLKDIAEYLQMELEFEEENQEEILSNEDG
jgi:hypothetical protein